jgi:uncharacterized protein YraI
MTVLSPALPRLACLLALVAAPALAETSVVTGLAGDDLLKLRRGPGTGFAVVVGLPNGTELVNRGCQQVGGTAWCEVSLREARALRGYVSGHYLRAK